MLYGKRRQQMNFPPAKLDIEAGILYF